MDSLRNQPGKLPADGQQHLPASRDQQSFQISTTPAHDTGTENLPSWAPLPTELWEVIKACSLKPGVDELYQLKEQTVHTLGLASHPASVTTTLGGRSSIKLGININR